jgi:hypothetical protein
MVILRKLKVTSNSYFNSLFYSCSKIPVSSTVGAHKANGSKWIAFVSLTYFVLSLFSCFLLKASIFFSSFLSLAFHFNFSKVLSFMASDNMK